MIRSSFFELGNGIRSDLIPNADLKKNEMKTFRIAASIVVCDPEGKILVVREAAPRAYGKVNLPGGHIEDGESVIECAIREVHEETGLFVNVSGFLGVYIQDDMSPGDSDITTLKAGQDILSCEWLTIQKILESDIIRPKKLRAIIQDLMSGRCYPKELIRNIDREE